MSNKTELLRAIKSIQEEYREFTYDFIAREVYCQEKLFNALRERIQGHVEKEINAIPQYRAKGSRVRMEVVPQLKGLKRKRHDICIFKDGIIQSESEGDIETIIEVKHGYHYSKAQVANKDAIGKDLKILAYYYKEEDTEAFLVYFMGNEFETQLEKNPEHINTYKEELKKGIKEAFEIDLDKECVDVDDICKNNILMVFLDKVVDGNMEEVSLEWL